MTFNFTTNQFINTTILNKKPFIIGSDKTLTDSQVMEFYQKLKVLLLGLKIPEGHPVCIYGEKEALFPVAMITCISLNIPYIPIDAIMPFGRIKNIQEQTESKLLINCSSKTCDVEFENEISKNFEITKKSTQSSFSVLENSKDPIRYILFTSGSTGIPKGVQITAKAFNSFVNWYTTWPSINSETVFMNQAPFSFDVSLCDFIGAFSCGSNIILNDYNTLKSGYDFLNRLKEYKATTIVCTPAFIKMYVSIPEFNVINFPDLEQLIFMGEELPASTVKKIKNVFPNLKVVNAFGPTEATVVVTYIEITDEILNTYSKSLPIGYCRPNAEFVILNKDEKTGIGELGLVGQNLSIGYFKDQEKTDKAFVMQDGKRIYKTGDVGYMLDDLIFYLGRNDNQVKLNGYRIELEEISNKLLMHQSVTNAAVIPLTANGVTKKIIAFVSLSQELINEDYNAILKSYLSTDLPSYMIPSQFIIIDEFPLNSNYKIDRKALLDIYMNKN